MSDTTNNEERNIQDEQKIDQNLKEIISKASKNRELTKDEIKYFVGKYTKGEIEIPKDKFVVFTDGNEQLIYDNGEFFLEDTLDSTKPKTKKKRAEAREMYIEYFIKYTLNKLAQKNNLEKVVETVSLEKGKSPKVAQKEKEPEKEKKQPELKKEEIKTPKKKSKDDELVR